MNSSPPNSSEGSLTSSALIYASNFKKLTEEFENIVNLTNSQFGVEQQRLTEAQKALEKEKEKFLADRAAAESMHGKLEDIVEINCGGRYFATYRSTLLKAPGSRFLFASLSILPRILVFLISITLF